MRAVRDLRRLAAGARWRVSYVVGTPVPPEYDDDLAATFRKVRRHTLTSAARVASLCDGVEYLVRNDIHGDIAECGVWKGGSMMAAALTLLRLGDTSRHLYLYDTYEGMTEPTEEDVSSPYDGYSPHKRWTRITSKGGRWAGVAVPAVQAAIESTGYPKDKIHCIAGKVEDTIPEQSPPGPIALLRLDTDWYESTKHELEHLYPALVDGGVLIIDDYGHYEGARKAVDEYFAGTGQAVLLNRIDYTGRVAVKAPGVGQPS
jgi:O-methyltransferase